MYHVYCVNGDKNDNDVDDSQEANADGMIMVIIVLAIIIMMCSYAAVRVGEPWPYLSCFRC